MNRIDTVVIGAGQAGLAMSHCLSDRGIEHVVFERGRVAERWRSERWDSLRLLTPNWQSRLPGFRYEGPDPDGYMAMPEVVAYFERYAALSRVPVEEDTPVSRVEAAADGFRVRAGGVWRASNVVIATGYCDQPLVPALAAHLPPDVRQLVPTRYRRPDDLPPAGVLIVGASASGIQLADEIHASGRPVTLAVGRHTRLPRRYRGRDILWWMDAMGLFDQGIGDVFDIEVSRNQQSLQLVGRPDHASLDLAILQTRGVRLAGKVTAIDGRRVWFDADGLLANAVAADVKLARLIARIDEFVRCAGGLGDVGPPEPFVPSWPSIHAGPDGLDLRAEGIGAVIWATGFRREYPWLAVPVLDERGELQHTGGVTAAPGLYVLGLQFQRRRKSSFIDGVGADATELAEHLAARAPRVSRRASRGLPPPTSRHGVEQDHRRAGRMPQP
jgi:putative flavoprotein involved in K+ transport